MPALEHFVMTKFNAVLDGERSSDREGRPVRTPEWMEHRFVLFERFCLPSVRAQTNLDFTWLVRYDEATPPGYLARLRAHEAAFDNLVLVPGGRGFHQEIAERADRRTRQLVTTRLDNDDGLHREAIALIQASCEGAEELMFLNLRFGYVYSYPDGRVVEVEDLSSNTLSLVEPLTSELPYTATRVSHADASDFAPVRQIGDEPMWIQVIHSRNIANTMRSGIVREAVDFEAFGLQLT